MNTSRRIRLAPLFAAFALSSLGLVAEAHGARGVSPAIVVGGVSITGSQSPATLAPGAPNIVLLTLDITNSNPAAEQIKVLSVENTTTGPGTQAQLDAELGSMNLYLDDGDGVFDPAKDALEKTTQAHLGLISFKGLTIGMTAGGAVRLFVVENVPTAVRDGDAFDVEMQSSADLTLNPATSITSPFPVDPAGSFPINGMVAAQITLNAVGPATLVAGSLNNVALDVTLPPDGYQPDVLQEFSVVNAGTAVSATDIAAIRAWVDDGDGIFNPTLDRALPKLVFTGDRWELSGLTEPVPLNGLHLFITVDLSDQATEGRTVRLGIPSTPSFGVDMASANDGPWDRAAPNPYALPITNPDRVQFAATPLAASTVNPGQSQVLLLDLVAASTYAVNHTLTNLVIRNMSRGQGTSAQLDGELQNVTLRADGNGNGVLDDPVTDPVIGTSFFSAGAASFSGLNWSLAAGATAHLFVTGDVALANAADADTLSANLAQASDVTFLEATRVVASWPVDSRSRLGVDGMVAAQIQNPGAPGASLAPGQGPVLALDFVIPRNGYAADSLQRIRLVNAGTAAPADLAEVHFWRDGGDGVFSAGGGDDQDLGVATWQAGTWVSAPLSLPLGAPGARIFTSVTVSASPTDSTTVQFAVPTLGITVASGNDGPIDAAVQNSGVLQISNSPLLATLALSADSSVVGRTVRLVMQVRNTGAKSIVGVTPSALTDTGAGAFTVVSGPTPASVDLAPGAADSLVWTLGAATAGAVTVKASASGMQQSPNVPRSTPDVVSDVHHIFNPATRLDAVFSSSMPSSVNLGTTNVVAFNLTLANAGGALGSPIRLRGFRVRLEDGTGAGIVPATLLSRVVVRSGAQVCLVKTALESSGSDVDLTLTNPIEIGNSGTVPLTLRLDVSSSATSPSFRVVIVDTTVFVAEDAIAATAVPEHFTNVTPPAKTGVARLTQAATRLNVSRLAGSAQRVGRGQSDVPLLGLHLQNPGVDGITSDAQVISFNLRLADSTGVPFAHLSDELSRIEVRVGAQVVASRAIDPADGPQVTLTMSPLPTIAVVPPVDLQIFGDVSPAASLGDFDAMLGDSTSFVAVDRNTQTPIPAVYATTPISGPSVIVEGQADSVRAHNLPQFPANLPIGSMNVAAMTVGIRHPGAPGTARIRVDSLTVRFEDDARRPLVPASYVSKLRVLWNGVQVASVTDPPASGNTCVAPLPGPLIEPGDSATAQILVDIAPAAPAGFLELMVPANGISAVDADLGTPVMAAPDSGADFPLSSGLTHLAPPPRDLIAGLISTMPAALASDGRPVGIGSLWLLNNASPASGSIQLGHLELRASDRLFASVPLGAAFTRVTALVADTVWAQSAALSIDSTLAFLAAAAPLDLAPGDTVRVVIQAISSTSATLSSMRAGFDAADIGVIQPSSGALQISVQPEPGRTFPLWTETGSFAGLSLKDSYSNFPNPFAAGRQVTSFAYYLRADARVTLAILTPDGERVARVLDDAPRAAGMHGDDRWDGRNGAGRVVRNGVYIAELVARYADGSSARELRKLAVVR